MDTGKNVYIVVACLAAAALLLESTLTRLLAVAQFYHFAFLVISLALLGFGASGSLLTIFPRLYKSHGSTGEKHNLDRTLKVSGVGFAASVGLSYIVVNWLPFDSYSIAWDSRQLVYFGLYYLVLTIPFIFAGLGIGAGLSRDPGKSNLIYAANLIGSAIGVLLALAVMQIAGVPGGLIASVFLALVSVFASKKSRQKIWILSITSLLVVGIIFLAFFAFLNDRFGSPIGVTISPYKGLSYALQIPGSERLFGAWNAISRLDVIAGASTRVMPGLSYVFNANLPLQVGMAVDGDTLQPITLITPQEFSAAAYLPEAIAFQLKPSAKALVVDAGGGLGAMQALSGGAEEIIIVVDNPLILQAISQVTQEYDIFQDERISVVQDSSRVFLASGKEYFDIIYMPLIDPYRPIASGAYSLSEDYLLTVESIEGMLASLSDGGIIVLSRWLQTPPSESLKTFATLLEALAGSGVDDPEEQILAFRGIQTMTFLVKIDSWERDQLAQVRDFISKRHYDLVWSADLSPQEINKYNKLPEPIYFIAFSDLTESASREEFYQSSEFAIQPATDNHPFFFHFFKWSQTPQILATIGKVWQPFGGSGYFVLLALLALVSGFSIFLIVTPLIIHQVKGKKGGNPGERPVNDRENATTWRVLIYFGSIGLAFLFLEIPLIQKSILSLEHPTYAFTLVVISLLIYSSIGSILSRKMKVSGRVVIIILFVIGVITPIVFGYLQHLTLGWAAGLKIIILGVSLAPLGIMMGMPFPLGLAWLQRVNPDLVPWAWGVNGCASVIASILAAILVLSFNFTVVLLLGATFYGIAALTIQT